MATVTEVIPMETVHMKLQSMGSKTSASTSKAKNRLRLDPLRALEPVRKKISTIEAQRVMAVLEETKKRVEIVTLLPWLVKNLDRFNNVFGAELIQMLQHHKAAMESHVDLEKSIRDLLDKRDKGDGDERSTSAKSTTSRRESATSSRLVRSPPMKVRPDSAGSNASITSVDDQLESAVRNLGFVENQLSHSTKNILRAFSLNPTAVNSFRDENTNRTRESHALIGQINELKDIIMEKLLTTPKEQNEKIQYLVQVTQQERSNSVVIDKLEGELGEALEEKDAEIKKKNDVIRGLQNNLHAIEKYSEETIRRTKTEAEKQEAADTKNSEGKCQKLTQEVNQLSTQLQNLITEHREEEQSLRKKKYKIEMEVENWIQKYDQDMGDRQDEFEEIDSVYTKEKKQLHELEERFKTLEEEYTNIMEEKRIAREKREAAERELQMMIKGATTIQAFWRSYKVRKALKAKKKGKGKKGKKGKK